MKHVFEAVWRKGKIILNEPININDNTRLMITVVDDKQIECKQKKDWQKLKGKYKGKLSTVDEFIRHKKYEKALEL